MNEKFTLKNENFFGMKMKHETLRFLGTNEIKSHLEKSIELQKKYKNFVIGFDLVGQEDNSLSHPSIYYMNEKLNALSKSKNQKFKF